MPNSEDIRTMAAHWLLNQGSSTVLLFCILGYLMVYDNPARELSWERGMKENARELREINDIIVEQWHEDRMLFLEVLKAKGDLPDHVGDNLEYRFGDRRKERTSEDE